MSTPQRLPIVNSDDGVWGDILRQYLMKEHFNDDTDNPVNGGHQKITVRAGSATAGTAPIKLTTGTLMTAAEAGAVEFNSDSLYFTITTGTVRKKVAIYDDSSGATGDLYYRDSSGNFVRLAAGANGKTLRVASGLPAWADASAGFSTATKVSNYTISGSDTVIFANATSGNVTITLPSAASNGGYRFYVKRIDSSANTCSVASSDNIDGQASVSLSLQYTSITIVSDGSTWYII
ncbi:MAG TPA: hypothetical protein VH144_02580 [Candidatus Saccharimonadales bacterium]|jgi:hypothetical protein|nr:hypothetical protein [Candidatus Saccharimonadales bacterium]